MTAQPEPSGGPLPPGGSPFPRLAAAQVLAFSKSVEAHLTRRRVRHDRRLRLRALWALYEAKAKSAPGEVAISVEEAMSCVNARRRTVTEADGEILSRVLRDVGALPKPESGARLR